MGKRWLVWLVLLALLGMGAGGPLEVASPSAGLVFMKGKVQVCPAGGAWQAAAEGAVLVSGDQLRTGPESVAVLILWDGTTMNIADSTQIKVVDLSQGADGMIRRFQVQAGRVWSNVQSSAGTKSTFEVEGPQAVAAVRGTAFEVAVDGDGTDVEVWEGQVETTSGGEKRMLSRFQRLRARAKQRAVVAAFQSGDAGPWQQFNLEVRPQIQECMRRIPKPVNPRHLTPEQKQCLRELYDSLPAAWQKKVRDRMQQRSHKRPGGR